MADVISGLLSPTRPLPLKADVADLAFVAHGGEFAYLVGRRHLWFDAVQSVEVDVFEAEVAQAQLELLTQVLVELHMPSSFILVQLVPLQDTAVCAVNM